MVSKDVRALLAVLLLIVMLVIGARVRAVHYVLGVPGIFLNTVGDLRLLPKVLDAASRFERRPTDETMAGMVESRRLTSLFGLPT